MRTRYRALRSLALITALATMVACKDDPVATLPSELQPLKERTAPYAAIAAAIAAGYDTPLTPCWFDRNQGGMGYHYGKLALIDGTPDLLNPEALIYEPQANGSMLFVGMEYIVPIDAWSGTTPPRLVGQDFMRNDALGVYAMHIWLWKENPAGRYAPWNPNVTCDHADEKEDRASATLVSPSGQASHGHH